jgi:dihydroorotase-like cyclic amidohydrolase
MKLIRNVQLASGNTFKIVNVLFDETILQVGTAQINAENVTEEYDYSGCIIIPGAVDMHTHILEGTDSDKKTLKNLTGIALSGGYTTLADMSYLSAKPVFLPSDLDYFSNLINENSLCDMALWGHCDFSEFPYHVNQMYEIWSAGVIGFLIMHSSPNHKIDDVTYEDIMELFDTIYDSDISFAYQGFDTSEVSEKKDAAERFVEQRLSSIRKILRRIQDNPLHFVGIYDKISVEMLNIAFRRSDLTYAFPVKQLMGVVNRFNKTGYTKDEPFSEYVKLLLDSMKNGKLYSISTEAGKALKTDDMMLQEAFSGASESLLQWTVPWVFSELWKQKRASIQSCIRILSENPAKRIGLFPQKGCIQKGSHADMVIIDPSQPVMSDLVDTNGNKMELSCSVKATFLRGNLQHPAKSGSKIKGQFIRRSGTTRRRSSSTCWT